MLKCASSISWLIEAFDLFKPDTSRNGKSINAAKAWLNNPTNRQKKCGFLTERTADYIAGNGLEPTHTARQSSQVRRLEEVNILRTFAVP